MKHTHAMGIVTAGVFAAALSVSTEASAQVGERGHNFGVGLAAGYPNVGLGLNAFLGAQSLQVDIAFRFRYAGDNAGGVFIRGDYLFYPATLANGSAAALKLYVGPGLNLGLGLGRGSGFGIGIEVPVGLTVQLHRVPIDLALEVVPVLQLLDAGAFGPDYFGIGGAFHVRYYF